MFSPTVLGKGAHSLSLGLRLGVGCGFGLIIGLELVLGLWLGFRLGLVISRVRAKCNYRNRGVTKIWIRGVWFNGILGLGFDRGISD